MAAQQCIFCSTRSLARVSSVQRASTRSLTSSARPHPSRRRRLPMPIASSRRWQSTEAAAAPPDPKIAEIVDQISGLTLLQTAELVTSLKSRLNIPDVPTMSFAPGPAAAGGAAAPAAAAEPEDDAPPPAQEKSLFNVKLQSFEAASKPKVIKEIKSLLGLSLVDSKKFVEGAPKQMKEGVAKEEGNKIVEAFKALGAVVVLE